MRTPRRCTPLWALLMLLLPGLGLAGLDPVEAEASRLLDQARSRADTPGAAVDLLRYEALDAWLPEGTTEAALRRLAGGRDLAPLNRAVAWYLVHRAARRRLDIAAAETARAELGLIDRWVWRPAAAPPPTDPLNPEDGWRLWPRAAGQGVLWIEAFARPSADAVATFATRIQVTNAVSAVLRLGFDDTVTVWLNGDEIYVAPAAHGAFIDQAAVPIELREGPNRLVIETRNLDGAWRLLARVTDLEGRPLAVEAVAEPWGEVAELPLEAHDEPEGLRQIWGELQAASEHPEPSPQALRDYVDYARWASLPDADQSLPAVTIETAWAAEQSPRTLNSWLRILPSEERAAVRAARSPSRPIEVADVYADRLNRLAEGWAHYYAQRHRQARLLCEALLEEAPGFLPAWRLYAVLLEDLDLPHVAVLRLASAVKRFPKRRGFQRAHLSALQTAGRDLEAMAVLEARVQSAFAGPDDHYALARALGARGHTAKAVALLDHVTATRPELWTYGIEAAEFVLASGDDAHALRRLEALADRVPGDERVALLLAKIHLAAGRRDTALQVLRHAAESVSDDGDLQDRIAELDALPAAPLLGPPVSALIEAPPTQAEAEVLYHHSRIVIGADGRAQRRTRRVIRLLSEIGARRYGTWELSWVPGRQELKVERARRVRAGAADSSPARTDRDLSEPEYRLYYDLRADVLTFDQPRPGDTIEVQWTVRDIDQDPAFPGYFGDLIYLQESIPRRRSVIELAGPLASALQIKISGDGGRAVQTQTQEGLRIVLGPTPAAKYEPAMPGASSGRAFVHLSSAQNWGEVRRRYRQLLADRDQPTQSLRALATRLVGDAEDDTERVARLYAEVAHRTRYVGLEFGTHSFQPEVPSATLARGYGDCKDKATLLIALVKAMGIEAQLVLARTRPNGGLPGQTASFAIFDHAFVYVPSLDRYLDPTVDRNDPWTLPPPDQGARVLVLGGQGGLRDVPAQAAEHNLSAWQFTLTLDEGVAQGTALWVTKGHLASLARRALEAEGTRQQVIEEGLHQRFSGARFTPDRLGGITPARDPVEVEGQVTLPSLVSRGGLLLGGGPWRLVQRFAHAAARQTPLQLMFKRNITLTLRLKGARAEAQRFEIHSAFGRFDAQVSQSGDTATLTVDLRLDAFEISPAEYPAFRRWLAAVDAALNTRVRIDVDAG